MLRNNNNAEPDPFGFTGVVDYNKLNLDPDPEFWPNLSVNPGLCYLLLNKCDQFTL